MKVIINCVKLMQDIIPKNDYISSSINSSTSFHLDSEMYESINKENNKRKSQNNKIKSANTNTSGLTANELVLNVMGDLTCKY